MGSLAQHESVGRDKQVKAYMTLQWSGQIIYLGVEALLLGLFLHCSTSIGKIEGSDRGAGKVCPCLSPNTHLGSICSLRTLIWDLALSTLVISVQQEEKPGFR